MAKGGSVNIVRHISAEEEALASVLCEAHRKLRHGKLHPTDAGRPNTLCYSIARAFIAQRVVQVQVDVDG